MDSSPAVLQTISLQDLINGHGNQAQELLTACQNTGFFYLNLEGSQVDWSWEVTDRLLDYGSSFFQKSLDDKLSISWDVTQSYFGYKPRGAAIVDKEGTPDSNEFLNISKDSVLRRQCDDYTSRDLMSQIAAKDAFKFTSQAHAACLVMLESLSKTLKIDPLDNLAGKHRLHSQSGDHLRLVQYSHNPASSIRPKIMLLPHTDFGSLTLLLTDSPGLQVLHPQEKIWQHVEPHAKEAIVNVGDTLVKLTNGLLRSCHHRVINASLGSPTPTVKRSLGYFLRPEDDVLLKSIESPLIPRISVTEELVLAKDWIDRRVDASKRENYTEDKDWDGLKGTAESWS